jgi:uncharacterized pyridoxal phosphate-containing UPF0001 family protein
VTEITDHFANIVERVARATLRSQRPEESVTIVAVSKQQSVDAIAAAYRSGLRHFGESYAQEALPKMAALKELAITWHFIGQLQTNDASGRGAIGLGAHRIGFDRGRLNEQRPLRGAAQRIDSSHRRTAEGGVADHEVAASRGSCASADARGLMTLPPQRGTPAEWFAALAALRARLASEGIPLDTLSMGMSADFEDAIAAGATLVRIGTAIFGARA